MKNNFKAIKNTLENILQEYHLEEKYSENYLFQNWASIINSNLSKVTKPVKYENQVLTIEVTTEAWKKELVLKENELIQMINSSMRSLKIEKIIII